MRYKQLSAYAFLAMALSAGPARAQLSSNPDKFLGNITTSYNVDYGNEKYYTLWNQITCENESKWASIEGNNNSFNWGGSDNAYNYAKNHNFPFKFHALIWGAQYPKWLESQTPEQRYKEIVQWMDEVKKHYPNLELIDVVNEAITGHQAGTPYFIEALGGTGVTGYDWLVKAFELAYERWPNAILIYNDFNTFQWNTDQYIDLVKALRNAGAPVDAYGCQSHDLTDCSFDKFKSSMTKIQNALKMPMYSTEYDIGTSDDNLQLQRYKEQIPYMWEADYVAGVTLWGYIYGKTWTTNGNSGIIRDGKDRPAMTWLREYMQSDAAKKATSPFPGMKKEASVYIRPQSPYIEKNNTSQITVRARMRTKTIEKIELYAANALLATFTETNEAGEYVADYTPTTTGTKELKAVVTCTDGFTWTRYGSVNVANPRSPYSSIVPSVPGTTIQFEKFDKGADGIAFHDNNSQKQGDAASFRTDATGIDIVKGGTQYAVGYTEVGEWMEYTLDVKESGLYAYEIRYSAPEAGTCFNFQLTTPEGQVLLTPEKTLLAKTGSWTTYKSSYGRLLLPLAEGRQILRFSITGGASQYVTNLDYFKLTRVELNEELQVKLTTSQKKAMAGTPVEITAEAVAPEGTDIKQVKVYADGALVKSLTEAPYTCTYTPSEKGTVTLTAAAIDTEGRESALASLSLTVTAKRTPFKSHQVPGTIEAEDFDKGEEGLTYHDSDAEVHDDAKYRTDSEGVDIVSGNGGYVIGWTASGEWLEYTIEVANPGYYSLEMVASNGTGTSASVNFKRVNENGSFTNLWSLSRSGTGSWSTYKTSKSGVKKLFEAGKQTIRVTFTNGNVNLDSFTLNCVEDLTPVNDVLQEVPSRPSATYNLRGQRVDDSYRGIVIQNGRKILRK